MKDTINLNFCFKGKRTYVHGTDIFTKLLSLFHENVLKIDIAFHGLTLNNLTFSLKKPNSSDVKVTFRCNTNNTQIKLFGVENNTKVDCRYTYHEENIVKNTSVIDQSIFLKKPAQYNFIEHIVAMNKYLLENIYTIEGKWYFTRLQLEKNIHIDTVESLELCLVSNFQFRLTKSSIIVNGHKVGYIYFSLVQKES
jgi:hypothetical protein